MTSVYLRVRFTPRGAIDGHHVFKFFQADYRDSSLETHQVLQAERNERVRLLVEQGPPRICVAWYRTFKGEQRLVGCSSAHIFRGEATATLATAMYRAVGSVAMSIEPESLDTWRYLTQTPDVGSHPDGDETAALEAAVRKAYTTAGIKLRDTVLTWHCESAPVLTFAMSATRIPAGNAPLFERLFAIAKAISWNPASDEQLLAEALSLITVGWKYRRDEPLPGLLCDQWCSLLAFPDLHSIAYDCEDGAKAAMELFLAFRSTPRNQLSERLQQIQDLAQHYTPWLVIGGLRDAEKNHYSPHCYLALLGDKHTITVEPTAFAPVVWGPSAFVPPRALRNTDEPDARVRIAPTAVRGWRLYGPIATLFSCSVAGGRAQQWIFKNGGIDAASFFDRPSFTSAICPVDMTTKRLNELYGTQLAILPRSRLPRPSTQPLPPLDDKCVFYQQPKAGRRELEIVEGVSVFVASSST